LKKNGRSPVGGWINLASHHSIGDTRAIPSQEVFDALDRRNRDVHCVDVRLSRYRSLGDQRGSEPYGLRSWAKNGYALQCGHAPSGPRRMAASRLLQNERRQVELEV